MLEHGEIVYIVKILRSYFTQTAFYRSSAQQMCIWSYASNGTEICRATRYSYLIAPTDLIFPTTNSGGISASSPHSLIIHSSGVRPCVKPPAALRRNNKDQLLAHQSRFVFGQSTLPCCHTCQETFALFSIVSRSTFATSPCHQLRNHSHANHTFEHRIFLNSDCAGWHDMIFVPYLCRIFPWEKVEDCCNLLSLDTTDKEKEEKIRIVSRSANLCIIRYSHTSSRQPRKVFRQSLVRISLSTFAKISDRFSYVSNWSANAKLEWKR